MTNTALPQSDVKGVTWNRTIDRWQVRMRLNGRDTYLGSYATRSEAEQVATRARSGGPVVKRNRASRSGVKHVTWNVATQRWHVRMRIDGRQCSFGLYDTLEEATLVARKARNREMAPGTNTDYHGVRPGRPRTTPPPSPDRQAPPPPRAVTVAQPSPEPRLPYLHRRRPPAPIVVPSGQRPTVDPPLPDTDPYRDQRMNPLSRSEIDRLRELARGPQRKSHQPH